MDMESWLLQMEILLMGSFNKIILEGTIVQQQSMVHSKFK